MVILLSIITCLLVIRLLLIQFRPNNTILILVVSIMLTIATIVFVGMNIYTRAYRQGQIDALSGDVKYEITTSVSSKWEIINDND